MAYDILQELPAANLALAHRRLGPLEPWKLDAWQEHVLRDAWVLDYASWEGLSVRVETARGQTPVFPRRIHTWHLYAPGVHYFQRLDRPVRRPEDLWILFTLARPHPFFDAHPFAALHDPDEVLPPLVRAMHALQQRGDPGREAALHGYLGAVLGHLILAARRGGAGTPDAPYVVLRPEARADPAGDALLPRVDRAVSRRLARPPSLDELAAALGLSVSSLSHRFRAETGMTVVERVRWLRIREGRRLLERGGATVKSVAHQLGFSSPFYFSRVFREVAGLTPDAYLRRQRGG
ncbi:MAG: helix-turn-helix domain-containing protein [Planctomycetota bacterium]|nr:helix-turn-helix domain-containing protein [Planctomycetota bacterium]